MTAKKPTTATKSTTPKKRAPRKSRAKPPTAPTVGPVVGDPIPPGLEHLWADGKTPTRADVLEAWDGPVEHDWPSWNVSAVTGEPLRAREDDGTFTADDPSTPDVNEAYVGVDPTPGTITQEGLARLLRVSPEHLVITDAYNGIGFQTSNGLYGVCMRDSGIEVTLCTDGESRTVFPTTSLFPVTIHNDEQILYTLDIDSYAGGHDAADRGDGLPAWLEMSQGFPSGMGRTERYIRAPLDAPTERVDINDHAILVGHVLKEAKRYDDCHVATKLRLRLRQALALMETYNARPSEEEDQA